MLSIAVLVRLDCSGPVLFRQKRYGFNNTVIEVLKFRTMVPNVEPAGVVQQARRGDPRLTRIGHRSEEHTSELQSLMRISSAASCSKKKQLTHHNANRHTDHRITTSN